MPSPYSCHQDSLTGNKQYWLPCHEHETLLTQGFVKVSVCSDVPPTDEELAELAFEGRQPPPPLGYVRVPVADLAGLQRR